MLLAGFLLLQGCSRNDTYVPNPLVHAPDAMAKVTRELAGPNAVDCGGVNPFYKPQRLKADGCAVAAFKARKPFRLMYAIHRDREEFANQGIVGTASGQVYFLANTQLLGTPSPMRKYLCKHPVIVSVNGIPRIACRDKRNLTH